MGHHGQTFDEGASRWCYYVDAGLYEAAVRALGWYSETGMRVATAPSIPPGVASWIVIACLPREL